ncbi:hypothetical protein DPMN_017077 [Dreissena polymorpha]|uniref:Uncharacterized protein n=1 Tax=Dreissena polymorpha TaxID=45954 RepID=A0A9D4NE17_DREPO|nr:hypothetical protein DPMN_017077 [Dreissena polymorpha]
MGLTPYAVRVTPDQPGHRKRSRKVLRSHYRTAYLMTGLCGCADWSGATWLHMTYDPFIA